MTFVMTATPVNATSVTLAFSGLSDNAATAPTSLYVQISPRPDFQFCVAPIYTMTTSSPQTYASFNQRSNYYLRARRRYSDGSVDIDWSATVACRTPDGAPRSTAPQNIMVAPTLLVVPEPIIAFYDYFAETLPGYPMENLRRDSPVAWRGSNGSDPKTHAILFNVAGPVDTVALLNTNLPESATIRVVAGATATQAYQNPSFDTGVLPFRASPNLPGRNGYHGLVRLPASLPVYSWWGVQIISDVPTGMIHAEHLVAGLSMVSKNYSNDKNESPVPFTTVSRSRAGAVDRVSGLPMRKVDFDLSMLSEAQYETIYGQLWRQQNNAVLVVPNARAGGFIHDRILYGDLTSGRTVSPSSPRFTLSLSVNSII